MLRDAAIQPSDRKVLEHIGMDAIQLDSLHRYRNRMKNYRPGHVWEELDDIEFLYKLGAAGRDEQNQMHPTCAGLLMFGHEYEIVKEFPDYFLDFQEQFDQSQRWTDRIVSTSGDWSGNIYDFYFRVYQKITQNLKVPFVLKDGIRVEDTPVHKAAREAIANCLINADYYGTCGTVITLRNNELILTNAGNFRIDIETAKAGGLSDPRNATLMKMFNMIDIGERAGSGIPSIYAVWHQQKWMAPVIMETFDPARTTMILPLHKESGDKATIKSDDKMNEAAIERKQIIIAYLKEHEQATRAELADLLGLKATRTKEILQDMILEGRILSKGNNRNRVYQFKESDDKKRR